MPALRVKRDVVPGMYTTQWFEATHVGQDDIVCAEYCGGRSNGLEPSNELPFRRQTTGHWSMHSMLHVESEEDFDKYLIGIGDPCAAYTVEGQDVPRQRAADQGEKIYAKKACIGCHTTTGAKLVGPSWKGIWGKEESTDHGTVKVDEAYVRESILAAAGEDRDRLPADDAVVQRSDLRPGDRRGHRVHQVAEGLRKEESSRHGSSRHAGRRWARGGRARRSRTPTT